MTNSKIGDVLIQEGLISEVDLLEALALQKLTKKKVGEILIEKEFVKELDFLKVLASTYQLPLVDLENVIIDEKLLDLFPLEMLHKYKVLPLELKGQNIIIATNDPLDVLALQEIRYVSGYQVKPVLASLNGITTHLKKSHESMETIQMIRNAQNVNTQDTSVVKLVNSILSKAVREGASDIHLEPQKDHLRIRFRIDGILFKKLTVPQELYRKVISRLKIMAGLDVAENRKPQDGRISWKEYEQNFDIRVSTLLDMHGEAIALRILNKNAISHQFESLGLDQGEIASIKDLIRRPYGIILVTGPTGAGKTTTLYSILNSLNQISTNIVTVEDPVEYQLDGITQTSINPFTDYSFANAIRYILRHDPDIIMVGEIRDVETAEISVRAALTGHLVLSTLHTNSAAGAITRLLEMNTEPFLLSSTVIGVVAQRLIRRLCPHCKKEEKMAPEIEKIISAELSIKGPLSLAQPVGCEKCFSTGYSGRVGLFEILKVTPDIRQLILKKANEQEITKTLVSNGMKTLRMAGYKHVLDKVTSYEEVIRVTLTEDM
jgi:type IV pilus assembly protein PilB